MKRLKQIAIGIDQLVNACLPGGFADETLSARAYRLSIKGSASWKMAQRIINALFFFQSNHCRSAYESELQRRQLPLEYRIS